MDCPPSVRALLLVPLTLGACDFLNIDNIQVEYTMHAQRFDLANGSFSEAPAPEVKRNLFDVVATEDGVLVLGGLDEDGVFSTAVEHYDPKTQAWSRRAAWPDPGLAWSKWVEGSLCTLGGYDELDVDVRTAVWCYDPDADTWSEGTPLPREYTSFYPTVQGGKIWIAGGTEKEGTIASPIADLWSYDVVTGEWAEHTPLPAPRGLAAVHAIDDRIYVVGGWDEDSFDDRDDTDEESQMLVYDIGNDSWSTAPQLQHARALYASTVVGGELVVFFGITDGPLVEIYDPATNAWREGTDPEDGVDGGVYSYVQHGDRLYLLVLVDGVSGSSSTSSGTLWAYDLSEDQWTIAGERTEGRDALYLGAVVDQAIHYVGAFTTFEVEFEQDGGERSGKLPPPHSPARRGVVLERTALRQ